MTSSRKFWRWLSSSALALSLTLPWASPTTNQSSKSWRWFRSAPSALPQTQKRKPSWTRACSVRPVVAANFVVFSTPLEGNVLGMYADVRGLVTIGMGVLVDPLPLALKLPLKNLGAAATANDISRAWAAVKHDPDAARLGWRYALANPANNLRLDPADADALTQHHLDIFDAALAARFSAFPTWPADAQLAVLSMCWAAGEWWHKFPKCSAFLEAGDFAGAATECRLEPEAGSLITRNDLNQKLLRGAAITTDADSLCWAPGP